MRKLYKQDIVEILYGATLLGAGGGGSLCFGLDMLKRMEDDGENIELDMLELSEIGDDEYAAMVAGLGSPVAMLDTKLPMFGPDAVYAFKAFQKSLIPEGKDVKYLYSGEMGGFNTFVPMMVAILSDKAGTEHHPELFLRPSSQTHGPRQPLWRRDHSLSRQRPLRRTDSQTDVHALQHAYRLLDLGREQS